MWFAGRDQSSVRTRKRQHERYVSDLLECALGDVLDLSASGIRIGLRDRCRLKQGQVTSVTLRAPQGELTLQARVVRVIRRRLRVCEVAFEFVGMKPRMAAALKSLAEFGFIAGGGIGGGAAASPHWSDAGASAHAGGASESRPSARQMELQRAREILRVSADSTPEQIRAAYRTLARRYHPDAHPGDAGDRQFVEVVEAYRLLRDAVH